MGGVLEGREGPQNSWHLEKMRRLFKQTREGSLWVPPGISGLVCYSKVCGDAQVPLCGIQKLALVDIRTLGFPLVIAWSMDSRSCFPPCSL